MTLCGDRAVGRMRNRKTNRRKESGAEREFSHLRIVEKTDSGSPGDVAGGGVGCENVPEENCAVRGCMPTDGDVECENTPEGNCAVCGCAPTDGYERRACTANPLPASSYLIARDEVEEEQRRRLLCDVLGPVFFGERAAGTYEELDALFAKRYGIDVRSDFCEGDEHYEEYQEAHQAIAEGLAIYGGAISFGDGALARLAEQIWQSVEEQEKGHFKRINTMLEE